MRDTVVAAARKDPVGTDRTVRVYAGVSVAILVAVALGLFVGNQIGQQPGQTAGRMVADHADRVRDAGSFTVIHTVSTDRADLQERRRTVYRYNLTSGTAIIHTARNVTRPQEGTRTRTAHSMYRIRDGGVIERIRSPSGQVTYQTSRGISGDQSGLNATWALQWAGIAADPRFRSRIRLTSPRTGTLDGYHGRIYRLDFGDRLSAGSGTTVTEADARAVFRGGYLRYLKITASSRWQNQTVTRRHTVAYRRVGNTSITPPAWLDDMEEQRRQAWLNETVTGWFNQSLDDGRVSMAVTATRGSLANATDIGPVASDDQRFRTERLDHVRAGSIVTPHWAGAVDLQRVVLSFAYRDREVPQGDESGLTAAYYNRTRDRFDPLPSMVDTARNLVRTTIDNPQALIALEGATMMAMHYQEYQDTVQ